MIPEVLNVSAISHHTLLLEFDSGEKRVFDVTPFFSKGIFRDLTDPAFFQQASCRFGTVGWPNGAEFDPEMLFERSDTYQPNDSTSYTETQESSAFFANDNGKR